MWSSPLITPSLQRAFVSFIWKKFHLKEKKDPTENKNIRPPSSTELYVFKVLFNSDGRKVSSFFRNPTDRFRFLIA